MKLVKSSKGVWQFFMNQAEADLLKSLLEKFPLTESAPVKISQTDADSKMIEREQLLHESLAEHRKELKKQAMNLVASDKFKPGNKGCMLTLNAEERETLLQILNDIRVGCWYALGKPNDIKTIVPKSSAKVIVFRQLMDLAGYFEHSFLNLELDKNDV